VLRIFSSITVFRREARAGVLHLFKESIERGVKVRVLIPADYQQISQIINEVNLVLPELSIRYVDKSLQNTIGILVIDRSYFQFSSVCSSSFFGSSINTHKRQCDNLK
jgi:hypothetical protein